MIRWVAVLQFLPQHLSLFAELSLSGTAAFSFIVSALLAGRFPSLQPLSHDPNPPRI
ncbi:hypothetical protein H6F80_27300 [Leptolyngbya sp. FACHB-711]|nr:hypothetical protein [Leptolyngbya sp. FACHB-711]